MGVNYISFDEHGGRIILTDMVANTVHIYDQHGKYEFSIGGTQGSGEGEFIYPCGTCVDGRGNILVCDTGNSRVQVFDSKGVFVSMFGGEEMVCSPWDIQMNEDGEVLVLDGSIMVGWSRIQIFKY